MKTRRCNVGHMASEAMTEADRVLLSALAARGHKVTPSQLKRWRAAGLLPTPERVAGGRGQGRRSTAYPEGTVARAAAVAEIVIDGRVPLRHAATVLFLRGFEVPEKTLKVSYVNFLNEMSAFVGAADGDPRDAADRAAQKMRRRAKRSLLGQTLIARGGTYGARQGSQLDDALVAGTAALFMGVDPSSEAAEAIAQIHGSPQSEQQDVFLALKLASVDNLRQTLQDSTLDSLTAARKTYAELINVFAKVHAAQEDAGQILLAPGIRDLSKIDDVSKAVAILVVASMIKQNSTFLDMLKQLRKSAEILP